MTIVYDVRCDACGRPLLQISGAGRITAQAVHDGELHETPLQRSAFLAILLRTLGKNALLREIENLDQALEGSRQPPED
jgi:hypothetical protein